MKILLYFIPAIIVGLLFSLILHISLSLEISNIDYCGVQTTYGLFPETRQTINKALEDGKITSYELIKINNSKKAENYKETLIKRVQND